MIGTYWEREWKQNTCKFWHGYFITQKYAQLHVNCITWFTLASSIFWIPLFLLSVSFYQLRPHILIPHQQDFRQFLWRCSLKIKKIRNIFFTLKQPRCGDFYCASSAQLSCYWSARSLKRRLQQRMKLTRKQSWAELCQAQIN